MAMLMSHTLYTLTQPETLGLNDNTLPNKNLITNVMDVQCILIEIFNGKQARRASSMLTKIEVKQTIRTTHTLAQILFSCVYTLRHCNARGCEYGQRETLVQCCSNAGLKGVASGGTTVFCTLRLFLSVSSSTDCRSCTSISCSFKAEISFDFSLTSQSNVYKAYKN